MTMTFKEALIAHLQGENVEVHHRHETYVSEGGDSFGWRDFATFFADMPFRNIPLQIGKHLQFRVAPRTITVNGVKVPAPESAAPPRGTEYYIPTPSRHDLAAKRTHQSSGATKRNLERGLIYLNKEDAIARAKAMIITKDV